MAEAKQEIIKIDEAIMDKEKYGLEEIIESVDGMPFTVDNRKMLEKMQKYRSTDPFSYIPEIIAIAVESGSKRIKVRSSLTQLSIEYDGKGLKRAEIDNLLTKLFGASEDRELQDRYGRLALSVLGALASKPKEVIINTTAGKEKTRLVIDGSNYEEKFYQGTLDKGTKITIKRCTAKEWLKKSLKKAIIGQYIKDKFFSKEKKKLFDYCKYIEPKLYFNFRKMNRPFRAPIAGVYRSKFEEGNIKGEIVDVPEKLNIRIGPLNCEFDPKQNMETLAFFFKNGIYIDYARIEGHSNSKSIAFVESPDFETVLSGNKMRQNYAFEKAFDFIKESMDGKASIACFNYYWNLNKRKIHPDSYIYDVLSRVTRQYISPYQFLSFNDKEKWQQVIEYTPGIEAIYKRRIFQRTDMRRISICEILEKLEKENGKVYCSGTKGLTAEPQDIVLYAPKQTTLGYLFRSNSRVKDLDEILQDERKKEREDRLERKLDFLFNIAGHSWKGIRKTTKYAAGAALVAGAGYGGYEVLSNLPTPDVSWLKAVLGVGGIGAGIGAIGLVAANADRLWYMTKKGLQGIADGSMYAGKIIKGRAGKCFKAIGTKIDEKLERRAKEKSKKENRKMQDTFKLSTEEERFLEYLNNQAKKYFSGANVPSNFLGGGFSYGILTDHVVAFESNSRKIMIQKKYPFIQYLIHEYDKDPDRIYYLMPGFFAFINTHLLHEQDKITPARHELLLQERATEIYHQNLYKKAYSAYTSEDSFDDFVKKTKALSEEQKKKLFWKILYKTDDKNAQKDLWISENHSAMLESIASEEIEIKTSRVPESYFHDPDEFKEEIIELYAKLDCDHRIINRIQDIYSNILDLNKKFNNESLNQWYLDNAAEHMGSSFREDLEKIKYIKAGVPDTYFRDEDVFSEHVSLMKPSEARKAYVAIMDLPTHRRSWKHIKAIREKFPQATAAVDASRQKTTWYSW